MSIVYRLISNRLRRIRLTKLTLITILKSTFSPSSYPIFAKYIVNSMKYRWVEISHKIWYIYFLSYHLNELTHTFFHISKCHWDLLQWKDCFSWHRIDRPLTHSLRFVPNLLIYSVYKSLEIFQIKHRWL